jgi:uncharacterized protein
MSRLAPPIELTFREDQSLRHLAEVLGIPAAEIGGALSEGEPWPLELPPADGASVELLPVAEPLPLSEAPAFLSDAQLGRLARELRLLGFDSQWRGALSEDEMLEVAIAEGRSLLTRDRALLFRRELARGEPGGRPPSSMLLLAVDPYGQLLEACARFGLDRFWRPLSLCSACGGRLRPARKSDILPLLPPIVAERYDEFSRCPACGKAYWKGDHARSIEPLLERLRGDLATR